MNVRFWRLAPVFVLMLASCASVQWQTRVFSIENPAVREYLSLSTSQFSTQAGSVGQEFFDVQRSFRPDQPERYQFSIPSLGLKETWMQVAMDKKFKNGVAIEVARSSDNEACHAFWNLIPGETYYYKVFSGRKILEKGRVKPQGQVRMIGIEKGFNIRDLGGWTGLGGRKVRYGQIYRGGSLGGTDKAAQESTLPLPDQQELHRIGIRAQLDLRAKSDAGKYAGEASLHSYSLGRTTLIDADFNNTMTDYGAYGEDASVVSDVAWIIYELQRGRPVYFNCRQGADRTGTIAFVLEGLLGCYEYSNEQGGNQMAMDYELTGFSQANLVDNMKVGSSHRPAKEAYENTHKLFRKLLDLKAAEPDIHLNTLQEKCYYYLNRQYGIEKCIGRKDLDWFICFMLNMPVKEYKSYQPTWARETVELKRVGESFANTVVYY